MSKEEYFCQALRRLSQKKDCCQLSYAIIRNVNYKSENLAGLYKHNERKNTHYSNQEINKDNFHKNYSLKTCSTTYWNAIKILQHENHLQGRIIKTTNVACEFIVTSDRAFFQKIGENETRRYFQTTYNFVASYQNLGEKYILSAKVHMDETTPHMHIVFVPVVHTKDKVGNSIEKIACSEYWKGKDSYKKLQDNFYQYMTERGFELERGRSRNVKHLSTEKLKQITGFQNIKYELEQEKIQPENPQNTDLVLAQNKQLIEYTNQLKVQLSKSYKAIETVELLRKENLDLRHENEDLKRENHHLRHYLKSTFEVVKHLFDFRMNVFKRLVDNFAKNFEK